MFSHVPTLDEFLALPPSAIYDTLYPQSISISMLLNGTRRWYISEYFDAPPADNSYFPHYLEMVLVHTARLLDMLAEHGLHRIFLPVYSQAQQSRNPHAHKFLLKGIEALTAHPVLVAAYRRSQYAVRFHGDMTQLPEDLVAKMRHSSDLDVDDPQHHLYYSANTGNPHNYLFKLAFDFGREHGRPPTWEDMLELYYGDRSLRPVNILIAFNHTYSREGIPPLLEGKDRIYTSVVTPLVLSEASLRRILYDYLYNHQDPGRSYTDIHPNEIHRLKQFYAANQETILGLMQKHEDLVYPLPTQIRPAETEDVAYSTPLR